MKKIQYTIVITLLFISSIALAQQETSISFYRQNMNFINPAYAGVDNATFGSISLRTQWAGIEDAPESQAALISTSLGNRVGFGITVINDKNFVEKQTYASFDISYKVQLNETANLYFGIKVGGNNYSVNTQGLDTYSIQVDPALVSLNTFNPNVGVGALYKDGSFFVSVSAPRLLNSKKAESKYGYATVASASPNWYVSSGYEFTLDSTFKLIPSYMIRMRSDAPIALDLTTVLQIDNNFEIGGMFRPNQAYGAMGTIKVNKNMLLGFAYEMGTKGNLGSLRNTNEFLFQYRF